MRLRVAVSDARVVGEEDVATPGDLRRRTHRQLGRGIRSARGHGIDVNVLADGAEHGLIHGLLRAGMLGSVRDPKHHASNVGRGAPAEGHALGEPLRHGLGDVSAAGGPV